MLSKCSQAFFDATFKSCQKSIYQLFNIVGYFKDIDGLIPLMFIPMSNKSERLYTKVLNNVVNKLKTFNIDLKSLTNQLMNDFEVGLRNSIKKIFPDSILDGFYFHYIKILWNHAKLNGLCKKNKLKTTKMFIFLLKVMPFVEYDENENFFKELETYFEVVVKYKKFLKYYKKQWINSEFINMENLSIDEYLNRNIIIWNLSIIY